MSAPTSRVPYVLDALVAAYTAALPSAVVYDGPPLQLEDARVGLFVGCTDETTTVTADQEWATMHRQQRTEQIRVPHLLFLRTGDDDISVERLDLYGYLATIESLIVSDITLGLVDGVVRARFASGPLTQNRTAEGLVLKVEFLVEVDAWLSA